MLLSHQVKIASRIDVQLSNAEPSDKAVEFQKLGYVTLSTNLENNYRARELKTVFIGSNLRLLRLVIHEPHQNKFNAHGQVGVINIQIFGYPLRSQVQRRVS